MDKAIFERISVSNDTHWWFKSRRDIFEELLKKIDIKEPEVLDFGSGVGANLSLLKKISKNIDAYEPNKDMHDLIKKKYNINVIDKIEKKYDLIFLTDVIEHIEDDKNEMKNIIDYLKDNGHLLITVPAYQFLFSEKDKILHHFRRYNKKTLLNIFPDDVQVEKISYYNFFLFFPIAITLLFFKLFKIKFIDVSEKTPNKIINYLMYKIFSFEKKFLNYISFPFGISIISLVKKIK